MTSSKVKQAKSILDIYRSLARITGIIYTLEQLEKLDVRQYQYSEFTSHIGAMKDYEKIKMDIILTWQSVPLNQRTVLFYSYLSKDEPIRMNQIATIMGYSLQTVEKWKSMGTKLFLISYTNIPKEPNSNDFRS